MAWRQPLPEGLHARASVMAQPGRRSFNCPSCDQRRATETPPRDRGSPLTIRQRDKRDTSRYRTRRADFVAQARAVNAPCWLYPLGHCVFDGAPIDYNAVGRTPLSPELHHKRPVATHPHLVMESANWAIGHARCNQVLGVRSPLAKPRRPSTPRRGRWARAAW